MRAASVTHISAIFCGSWASASKVVPKSLIDHIPAPKRVTGIRSPLPPSNALSITSLGFIASPFSNKVESNLQPVWGRHHFTVPQTVFQHVWADGKDAIGLQTAILWIVCLNSSRSTGD